MKVGSILSNCTTINADVPQGIIFGPLVLYIITCDRVTHVDDCTIWEAFSPSSAESSLQTVADEVAQWTTTNTIALNYDKTEEMDICFTKRKNTRHPGDIDKRETNR